MQALQPLWKSVSLRDSNEKLARESFQYGSYKMHAAVLMSWYFKQPFEKKETVDSIIIFI